MLATSAPLTSQTGTRTEPPARTTRFSARRVIGVFGSAPGGKPVGVGPLPPLAPPLPPPLPPTPPPCLAWQLVTKSLRAGNSPPYSGKVCADCQVAQM